MISAEAMKAALAAVAICGGTFGKFSIVCAVWYECYTCAC